MSTTFSHLGNANYYKQMHYRPIRMAETKNSNTPHAGKRRGEGPLTETETWAVNDCQRVKGAWGRWWGATKGQPQGVPAKGTLRLSVLSFLIPAVIRYNSYTIKFTHFKGTSLLSMVKQYSIIGMDHFCLSIHSVLFTAARESTIISKYKVKKKKSNCVVYQPKIPKILIHFNTLYYY